MQKNINKYLILFGIGGAVYYLIECIFHLVTTNKAYSHWTMFVLAGFLFVVLGLINELFSWETPLLIQSIVGAAIATLLEYITGCIVNIWLGWNVWDYSSLPFSLHGQINLFFSIAWIILSAIAIVVDDWLRYWWFDEEKPHYKILG